MHFDTLALYDSKGLFDLSTESGSGNFEACCSRSLMRDNAAAGPTAMFLFHLSPDEATFSKLVAALFEAGGSAQLLDVLRAARHQGAVYLLLSVVST